LKNPGSTPGGEEEEKGVRTRGSRKRKSWSRREGRGEGVQEGKRKKYEKGKQQNRL